MTFARVIRFDKLQQDDESGGFVPGKEKQGIKSITYVKQHGQVLFPIDLIQLRTCYFSCLAISNSLATYQYACLTLIVA